MSGSPSLRLVDEALHEHFGQRPVRASVSFVGVESLEVLRFEPVPGERAYVTLGMSRHPMTGAAETVVAHDGPRAELMLHVADPHDRQQDVWRRLAVLGAAPAVEAIVHTEGSTVDLGEPIVTGSRCTGGVLVGSAVPSVTTPDGDVAILQVLPATATELAWSRVHGSAALRDRWAAAQTDLLDLLRAPVALG